MNPLLSVSAVVSEPEQLPFTTTYPHIARFVADVGYIEVGYGHDGYLTSFIRALDEGGMVWEGEDAYPTLDAAFAALDAALAAWLAELGIL